MNQPTSLNRFQSARELTDEDKSYLHEIDALSNMHTPEGYTASVSACLKKHGFGFRLVHVRG